MNWTDLYLACFIAGFSMSAISLLAGGLHLPHLHLHLHGSHGGGKGSSSPFNLASLAAFLAWFGAAGYLLTRYAAWWFVWALLAAIAAGLAGGSIIFWFLGKFLLSREKPLDPADYEMIGVLGRVTSPVRENGTGEMIFSQEGRRRGVAVRCDGGGPIPKDAEVVVTRYERGIAYVKQWDQLTGL